MEQLILDYLSENWSKDSAQKIQFSSVPKGQTGDLAMNFFALTKELGKNPIVIGSEIAEVLSKCDLVEKTEQAGPYLNLFFSLSTFFAQVFDTKVEISLLENKEIILEYSGPNTNKPLHLGHMRNHALGISLGYLLEAAGATVHRVNIINDKGLALAKSMLAYDQFGENKTPESEDKKSDHFAGDWYVRYDFESKKNPELEKELPDIMRAWEAGDEKWVGIWNQLTDWVISGVEETYERQGVWFDLASRESEHYERGREFAYEGLEKGVFKQREDQTIYIDLKDQDMGEKVVLRADGTAIYLTQDLSLWPLRKNHFGSNIDEMIYVVGDEQNYYFQTVFTSLKKLNLVGDTTMTFYGYGLVNLPDGRMKSREGTVVDADNLMDELSTIAEEEITKRNPELSQEQSHDIAEQIMNGAWKFFLLRTSPNKTITFDAQKSIDFQGATGPYLQYAGVRIKSIFEKEGLDMDHSKALSNFDAFTNAEKALGVKILEWPKVLTRSAEAKNPTLVVTYLLELAQSWSSFYGENSILNADSEALKEARLALAAKIYQVLDKGLSILGISIPVKM